MNNLLQQILAPLRGMWPWQQGSVIDTDSPYVLEMLKADGIKGLLAARRRDRGVMAVGCFLLASISLSGNYYQLTQQKEFNNLVVMDKEGEYMSVQMRRAENIPDGDWQRQVIIRKGLKDYVQKLRERVLDKETLATGLTAVAMQSVGPAQVKLTATLKPDDKNNPFERIKRERVEVKIKGEPKLVIGHVWQVEWTEKVKDIMNNSVRDEEYTGRFKLVHDPKWINPDNVFGLKVADREVEQLQ